MITQFSTTQDIVVRLKGVTPHQYRYYLGTKAGGGVYPEAVQVRGLDRVPVTSCDLLTLGPDERCCSSLSSGVDTLFRFRTRGTLDAYLLRSYHTKHFAFDVQFQTGYTTSTIRLDSDEGPNTRGLARLDLGPGAVVTKLDHTETMPMLRAYIGPDPPTAIPAAADPNEATGPDVWLVGSPNVSMWGYTGAGAYDPLAVLPRAAVGPQHGQIGITLENWASWWDDQNRGCSDPEGSLAVHTSSASSADTAVNQMSGFEGMTIADYVGGDRMDCSMVTGGNNTRAFPEAMDGENTQAVTCDHRGRLNAATRPRADDVAHLVVQFDINLNYVTSGRAALVLPEARITPWERGSTATNLYLDLNNTRGTAQGEYRYVAPHPPLSTHITTHTHTYTHTRTHTHVHTNTHTHVHTSPT